MDRRKFFQVSAASLFGLGLESGQMISDARRRKATKGSSYSVVILGDTHFDTVPDTVYHEGYSDPNPTRDANHRTEFVRNGEMWRDRSPRLVKRASQLVDGDTRMVFQMGDIIQGDTGSAENHRKMLDDAFNYLKTAMGPLPFVTVIGNHDFRSVDDKMTYQVYKDYMQARMSKELGQTVESTNFAFNIGEDAYIVIDFNKPNDAEVEQLLGQTDGARYTFLIVHGPLFPYDSKKYWNWFYHGKDKDPQARRHMRELFAKRNVIVLCGHTHTTELTDWVGDGGRIVQMTMNSVWGKEEYGTYKVALAGAEQYGTRPADKTLFDEYRPGLQRYTWSNACGSYKLNVSPEGVTVDFWAGDSQTRSEKFILR